MNYHFKPSPHLSLGLELELQIIDPQTQELAARAKDLIRIIHTSPYAEQIKPEITQSMIEVNSLIHTSANSLHVEIVKLTNFLSKISQQLQIVFCGGGTHPIQRWHDHKIFPSSRFRDLSRRYGYLAKRFTIFSMHVHVGITNGDDAIYLTHLLSRYIPQLITLSASSPFYQSIYTGYHSSRVNVVNAFPLSGHLPIVKDWAEFSAHYQKLRHLKIIESMKDLYWDIRPKAEYGTVEIRICDMPLSILKAVTLVGYIQTLAHYILSERPNPINQDLYEVYDYNRFQASRYGFEADFINPFTLTHTNIQEDILATITTLEPFAKKLGNEAYLADLKQLTQDKINDANFLKEYYVKTHSLECIVKQSCAVWQKSLQEL
jgi:glutamate---cysteine ligase / carboxylate-amine ligase